MNPTTTGAPDANTTIGAPAPTQTTVSRARVALLAVCAGLAINGLVLGPSWLLAPAQTFSDTAAVPTFALSQRISWVLLLALVPLVPVLLSPGRRGTPPAWLAPVVQVGVAAQACTVYVTSFVAPWLVQHEPYLLDIPGGTFQWVTTAVWVSFMGVMVVVAVALWRAGHSRVGAVLAVLGAVATPGIGPIGTGVLAVGLGLVALGQLRGGARQAVQVQSARV